MNAPPRFSASVATPVASNIGSNIGRNSGSNIGANISRNISRTTESVTEMAGGLFQGWIGILLIVVLLMIVFAVYYNTIGYYIQLGWDKLQGSRARGERVEVQIPGGPSAELMPAMPAGAGGASSISSDVGAAIRRLETDVETALGTDGRKQVFNVSRNLYTFAEAEPLCRAFGAELATYDQVKDAYEAGADWCNYGWVKGQLAVYPTQKDTYEKLQHGPEEDRMSCGLPGVNGGYFPNADQRFGVNCYGERPVETALDERVQMEDRSSIAFDREVTKFKAELDSIAVNPWNEKQWSK
jgi:hypothetical protein